MPEASLAEAASGVVPASEGWFVVNVTDAAWVANPGFRVPLLLRGELGPALRESPELEQVLFAQLGLPPPRSRAAETQRPLSRRVGAGGLPRARGRVPPRRRGGRNGAFAPGTSSAARPGTRPRLRWYGRPAVRAPHDRRAGRTRARSSIRSPRRPLDTAPPPRPRRPRRTRRMRPISTGNPGVPRLTVFPWEK